MNPRLELDFAASPRRRKLTGWLLLAVALACAIALALRYQHTAQRVSGMEERLSAVQQPRGRSARRADDPAARAAEALRARLAVPWGILFRDLEQARHADIALLSAQPNATSRLLRVTGAARDRAALEAYIGRLEASGSLEDVYLASHELAEENGVSAIRFALTARWTFQQS